MAATSDKSHGGFRLFSLLGEWLAALWDDEPLVPPQPDTATGVRLHQIFNEIAHGTIKTERLVLRHWTEKDAEALAEFMNADGGAFQTYFYGSEPEVFSAEDMRDEKMADMEYEFPYKLAVFKKGASDIIGMVGFWRDDHDRPRLTYFILPSERRHGYAMEAYMAALGKFASYGERTEMAAEVMTENTASQEFLKKAGWTAGEEIISDAGGAAEGEKVIVFRRGLSDLNQPAVQ